MSSNVRFAYARHALVAAFRHLGARPGDVVAIPEFICRDVLASLHHVDVRPHYYPVGRDLRPLNSSIEESIPFVLMVNYFGFPQNIDEFRLKWPNAQIIEDNAHGYLSRDEHGLELGTRTEAGVTSCRKTILSPDGAILYTLSQFDTEDDFTIDSRRPSLGFIARASASRLERATGVPVNFVLRSTLRALRKARTGSSLPRPDEQSEYALPRDVLMSHEALKILERVDSECEVNRRRQLFEECMEIASKEGVEGIFKKLPKGCAPYGFPFFAPTPVPSLDRFARRKHCEVIGWPDLPSAISVPADHFYRHVRVVNFL